MSTETKFTRFSDPRPMPFADFCTEQFTVLHAAGIVNPFGPTLAVLATDGVLREHTRQTVVQFTLNPFHQTCEAVGCVDLGHSWKPVADISQYFPGPLNGCPSLLLPTLLLKEDDAIELCASYLRQFANGRQMLELLQRFPKDPWQRVKSEAQSVVKPDAVGGRPCAPLDQTQARALAELQLDPQAAKAELQAFLFAWGGSIKFQGNGIMAKAAMPIEQLAQILAVMALSCRVPPLGK